ncbi:MAG: PQQ-dependent sugar dehydrogenase, partial [Steroidobacteraceae bacterium]
MPKGLYVTKDGRVWSSEHSAQGGDEINLLVAGNNYGWPLVTYGTDYGSFIWPYNARHGLYRIALDGDHVVLWEPM